jgi:hypothetical protein
MTYTDLPLFRATDPDTSKQTQKVTIASQRATLLAFYYQSLTGLTDEEVAEIAEQSGFAIRGYWKRCSDLRRLGLVQDTGQRRTLSSGRLGMVCVITQQGIEANRGWA